MASILILYPREFNCFSKFQRKMLRILENLGDFAVVFPEDPNSLIEKYFSDKREITLTKRPDWPISDITHAVIFDDGENFPDETSLLKEAGKIIREIKIAVTRVINIKTETEFKDQRSTPKYEYIGRGSYWGNPYSMFEEGDSREEVIEKYEYDFQFDRFPNKKKSDVYKLSGKRLGCFCKPEACHGDVLANYLNSWDDGQ